MVWHNGHRTVLNPHSEGPGAAWRRCFLFAVASADSGPSLHLLVAAEGWHHFCHEEQEVQNNP